MRLGPVVSHEQQSHLPPSSSITLRSPRENHQRPNEFSAHATNQTGTTSHQRSTLPTDRQGHISHQGSTCRIDECSPTGGYQTRVCQTADPLTLIRTLRRSR